MSVMLGLASHHGQFALTLLPVVGGSLSVALAYAMNEKGVSKYWLGSLLARSESSVTLLFVSSEFLLGMGM